MAFGNFESPKLSVTPQLRAFLRAELAQVVRFEALDGEPWSPYKIASEIRDNPDIQGGASDDTIARFLSDSAPYRTRQAALEAIAGFLLVFEFIAERDLKHYQHPAYERAASALAGLYGPGNDTTLTKAVLGVHRFYRTMGADRLAVWTITFGSPDDGESVSVTLAVEVLILDDAHYFLEESKMLDPSCYQWLREETHEQPRAAEGTAPGIAVLTSFAAFAVIGGDEYPLNGVLGLQEMHRRDGDVTGMRARWSPPLLCFDDGLPLIRQKPASKLEPVRRQTEWLSFYPQGKPVEKLPEIDAETVGSFNGKRKGHGLTFQGSAEGKMSEIDEWYVRAQQEELAFEEAFAACENDTERLAWAIDMWDPKRAIRAIEAGADVNAMHEDRGIPMVHAAASLGMSQVIDAMMERDVDLTVFDRFRRRPSTCAAVCAGNFELCDKLTEAQAQQYREKGVDPRLPPLPEPE